MPNPIQRRILFGRTIGWYYGADQAEIQALIDLYNATGGPAWTDHTNWLTAADVSTWNGVTTAGGHITQLNLATNNLVGAMTDVFGNLPYLTSLSLQSNSLSGSLINCPTSLTYLNFGVNSFTVVDTSALINLAALYSGYNSLMVLDISALINLVIMYCNNNNISVLDTSEIKTTTQLIRCQNNGMSQAVVDTIISDIYARRAAFTYATPDLNVGGTNATPTGTYQSVCPATTALEEVHNLANDGCVEGHTVWTVTWTGGSAP